MYHVLLQQVHHPMFFLIFHQLVIFPHHHLLIIYLILIKHFIIPCGQIFGNSKLFFLYDSTTFFFDSYPFEPAIPSGSNPSYDFVNYHSPFVFQDMSNYQYQTEFRG
jgi:hypothetical protein